MAEEKRSLVCDLSGERQETNALLRTRDKREARKLKRAIETTLEERGMVVLDVSDRPKPETKVDAGSNPSPATLDLSFLFGRRTQL